MSTKGETVKDPESSLVAARSQESELLRAVAEAEVKKVYLDSGANVNPLFNRAEEPNGVETVNQGVMPVEGHSRIAGVDAVICSGANASLFSMGQVCDEKRASCVVTSSWAEALVNSTELIACLNDLTKVVIRQNSGLLYASRNPDSMYEITQTLVPPVMSTVFGAVLESGAATGMTTNTVTGDTDAWSPSPELIERHSAGLRTT